MSVDISGPAATAGSPPNLSMIKGIIQPSRVAKRTTTLSDTPTARASVTPIPGVESAGPLNDINDLAFAPDGHLWAATAEGLVRWDVMTSDYLILGEKEGVPAGGTQTVEIAPDGTVWVLGDRGIGRYDGS